ncbi:putative ribonuclease H-like domain-containing protein [Tanacetum coccineum]
MPALEDYSIFDFSRNDEDDGAEADMNNLDTTIQVSPIPTTRIHKDHPLDQVIGDLQSATQTRKMSKNLKEHGFVIHALKDPSWIEAMQEELLQFKLQEVWTLVDLSNGKRAIGTKWVFRNKKDERGIMIRNKARLVAQGYTQEEGIDYDEAFSLVYVCQPPGFEDPDFLDRVYKVEKALYGLPQAPRAWYETLSTYLLDNRFQRREIDKTFFIKRHKGDILLMSSMGELTFFLGLQVQQKKDGIFISQDKYVVEILKKFGFTEVKTASTPMETQKPLLKDEDGEEVDVYMYRSMIGSLMYLTSSRPDIMFSVCACARYQVNPKVSHLHAVKRIFRYLKGQPKLGLWYPKDSPFDLVAYTDSDYAGASLDRKSTIGGKAKKRVRLMMEKLFGIELELILLHALVDGKKIIVTESTVRRDLQLEDAEGIDCLPNSTIFEELTRMGSKTTAWNEFSSTMASAIICLATNQKFNFSKYIFENIVPDEAVHKELGDSLVRAATTASSLESEQDNGNINKTRSKATPNKSSSKEPLSGGGRSAKTPWGIQLLKLDEDSSQQGRRINVIDADEDITLVNVQDDVDNEIFDVDALNDEGVNEKCKTKVKWDVIEEPSVRVSAASASIKVSVATTTTATIPTPRKGIVITELGTPTITRSLQQPSWEKVRNKGKGKMIDEEERIARVEEEKIDKANITWDDIQEKVNVDYQLAERLQTKEQEQFTIEEKATLFKELLD